MTTLKTNWWWPYLTIQALALLHWFYPLPFHYRHHVGKWVGSPAMPGLLVGMVTDACIRSGSVSRITVPHWNLANSFFVAVVAELFNCGLCAVAVWLNPLVSPAKCPAHSKLFRWPLPERMRMALGNYDQYREVGLSEVIRQRFWTGEDRPMHSSRACRCASRSTLPSNGASQRSPHH